MLNNPWGIEHESYIHDVGKLDDLIDVFEQFDQQDEVSLPALTILT